jgi:hypothetical protein
MGIIVHCARQRPLSTIQQCTESTGVNSMQRQAIENEIIAHDPKNTAAWSILGDYHRAEAETLIRMRQPAKALESYRAAAAIYGKLVRWDPHNADARVMATATEARTGLTLLQIGELAVSIT